ncbi:response regulator receiver domain protein [Bordetella pertussis STO1-CHOC-0018]|nr:response regulator receiver domain protein [Bordetella pertussis STO1-CHOC-0018]
MARILVVDDEVGIRELLSEILYDEGHTVELAENAAQARAARLRMRPDLVLLDIWMPDTDGVSLLKEWASQGLLDMPVIMMSGHATIDTAVEATRIGAMDFLEKPITLQRLLKTIEAGLARVRAPRAAPPLAHAAAAPVAVALEDELDPRRSHSRLRSRRRPLPTASWAASRSTSRCARRATNSSASTSNTTWCARITA